MVALVDLIGLRSKDVLNDLELGRMERSIGIRYYVAIIHRIKRR